MRQLDERQVKAPSAGVEAIPEMNEHWGSVCTHVILVSVVLISLASPLWADEGGNTGSLTPAPSAFQKAIDELFAQGYPQKLEEHFCSLGTNPDLGFRWAGTTAEHTASKRIEAEMRSMGLRNVRKEPVPVDVFEFGKASVTVGSRKMVASTFAGVAGTPKGGITAAVVYVKGGTAADFEAVGDVSGKIVLIDNLPRSWWFWVPAMEAMHRKAAGAIFTSTPEDDKYFSFNDRTLGSFDSSYDPAALPLVYICRQDGDWLKAQIHDGKPEATVVLDQQVTLAEDGGVGYNVVGELPGSRDHGQMILLLAHQDAHFRAGLDDTGALVNMLSIAKAMCMSEYRPAHTVVFMATCAEEFGRVNSSYDWAIGSWWAITHEHKDWVGKTRAVINLEGMAVNGTPLLTISTPELKPWLTRIASSYGRYLPFGSRQVTPAFSWTDQWSFTATGIPSVSIDTLGLFSGFGVDDFGAYPPRYHTNFDTQDLIDWKYLADLGKVVCGMVSELDDGLLPYDLTARAKDLAAAVGADQLIDAGADASTVSQLVAAVETFVKDARAFHARSPSVPSDRINFLDERLLEVVKVLNAGLTALSPRDDSTIYPHQAVLNHAIAIRSALAALKTESPGQAAALKALEGVGETAVGAKFSPAVHQKMMERKNPNYARLHWASLGKLPVPVDVMPEYRAIERGEISQVVSSLEAKHRAVVIELNKRLEGMASVLSEVHALMEPLF